MTDTLDGRPRRQSRPGPGSHRRDRASDPLPIRTDNRLRLLRLFHPAELPASQDADEILPALFSPLVDLNDQNEWASELLVQVPTIDNGGAAIVGDQLVVTYELLPGLLWSDGAPLTSDDIRFTWELMTQPSTDSDSYLASVNPLWQIESIDTPDPLTAVVTYRPEYFPPGLRAPSAT